MTIPAEMQALSDELTALLARHGLPPQETLLVLQLAIYDLMVKAANSRYVDDSNE